MRFRTSLVRLAPPEPDCAAARPPLLPWTSASSCSSAFLLPVLLLPVLALVLALLLLLVLVPVLLLLLLLVVLVLDRKSVV